MKRLISVLLLAPLAILVFEARSSSGDPVAQHETNAASQDDCSVWSEFRAIIGDDSPKIRREGDQTWIWAGGDPSGPGAVWFDFTGSPIPVGNLQYGIGKDRIPSIEDPVFVDPDDPRLMSITPSPYRECERPEVNDEIMVFGYVTGGEARAYPTALLDRHEIVNDVIAGENLAIGWCPLADLAAVHERGDDEFGVSGYVYQNTFLIFDRATDSLWYPLDDQGWTAVAGPRQGEFIPFLEVPAPLPLGEWRERHPDTVVLLGSQSRLLGQR